VCQNQGKMPLELTKHLKNCSYRTSDGLEVIAWEVDSEPREIEFWNLSGTGYKAEMRAKLEYRWKQWLLLKRVKGANAYKVLDDTHVFEEEAEGEYDDSRGEVRVLKVKFFKARRKIQ